MWYGGAYGEEEFMDDYYDDYYDDDDDYLYDDEDDHGFDGVFGLPIERLQKVNTNEDSSDKGPSPSETFQVPSLVDISSRFVALKFPFAYIEHRNPPVPDELQLKVISFSFPDNEDIVQKYAEFSRDSVNSHIAYARQLCKNGSVKNLTQIGFRLSATVEEPEYSHHGTVSKHYVVIHFDRGRITNIHCSCNSKLAWCRHVVAVAFERIASKQDTTKVCMHLPVSDTLNLLNREQLLKFAQYLLCEHKNEPVVDSAQQLLDKLLHPGGTLNGDDNINLVAGAPDITAGPGMDEDAHWFVCTDGFQRRCEDTISHLNTEELGFGKGTEAASEENHKRVKELWQKHSRCPAIIKDSIDDELDSSGDSFRPRQPQIFQVFQTVSDLLKDDSITAVAALQVCTEQLVSKLRTHCCRKLHDPQGIREVNMGGSSTGRFTPRALSCRTIVLEVSRLWRIAVLHPKLSVKNCQEILQQLTKWNQEVNKYCHDLGLCVWQGLEVSVRLAEFYQENAEVASIMKRPCLIVPAIRSCMAVDLNENAKPTLQNSRTVICEDLEEMQDATSMLSDAILPHLVSYSPTCTLDIHTVCSLVEALDLYGNSRGALCLAVGLSVSIVSFYKRVIQKRMNASELPVSGTYFFGTNVSPGGQGVVAAQETASLKECRENAAGSPGVWPTDTLLTVTTFAFLFDVLSKHSDDADSIVMEMSSERIKSAKSLMFQLGLVGLHVPKLPAPTKQHEVDQYECESWLTSQLIEGVSPSDQDKELLSSFGHLILSSSVLWYAAPPSSLARVIFHHLFAEAPASLDVGLTTAQKSLGLDVAFHLLRCVYVPDEKSKNWCFFHYSVCRLWSKLAEVVLRSVAEDEPLLEEAMGCILRRDGLLGPGADVTEINTEQHSKFHGRLVEIKCDIAYGLSKAVSVKISQEINKAAEEKPKCGRALSLRAIQLGVHSLWLQKRKSNIYSHINNPRWLIELALELGNDGIECLLRCNGDVTTFLEPNSALELCGGILGKGDIDTVQVILTAIVNNEATALEDIRRTISFCGQLFTDMRVLIPWVGQLVRTWTLTRGVSFHILMDASVLMFEFCKTSYQDQESELRPSQDDSSKENRGADKAQEAVGAQADKPRVAPDLHPHLEMAFALGLKALKSFNEQETYYVADVYPGDRKSRLVYEFCELVIYIVLQSWKKDDSRAAMDQANEQGAARAVPFNRHLSMFVHQLLEALQEPYWLFDVLKKLCTELCPAVEAARPILSQVKENEAIKDACSNYPSLHLLLQKNVVAFNNLLLGPKIARFIDNVTANVPAGVRVELEYEQLEGKSFKGILKAAQRLHLIFDSSGSSFDDMTRKMEASHPVVKAVFGALKRESGAEQQTQEIEVPFHLLPFLAHGGAFPFGYSHRDPMEEFPFG